MPTERDLFAQQAPEYARFRPTYPPALFDWLAGVAPGRDLAVDVGTGSGQSAVELGERFARVVALDPSEPQLAQARPHARVTYRRAPAEATGVDAHTADLLTASQAFHRFDRAAFFEEARRILRPGGVVAIWCYGLATISPEIDAVVMELYEGYLGSYWDPGRRSVERLYGDVIFPIAELTVPRFDMRASWAFEHLVGYLETWSALVTYKLERGSDPMAVITPKLRQAWGDAHERIVTWELGVRAAKIP
jgi:SAM-dependent methyltransferase